MASVMKRRKDVLNEAMKAVTGDRHRSYGSAEDNFGRIALLWNAYLDTRKKPREAPLDTVDVAIFMNQMKVARLAHTPAHFDSWTDIAGYAACGAECAHSDKP